MAGVYARRTRADEHGNLGTGLARNSSTGGCYCQMRVRSARRGADQEAEMAVDTGYFSDASMIRRVMRKRAVGLTYGLRALVIGAVNPLLYVGTAESTEHRDTPYTRLALTGKL